MDARTDVFAFGVVLYEMVTGQRPFVGESVTDVLTAVTRDAPKRASEVNPLVSADIDGVLERCLEKKAERRYANGQQLVDGLKRLIPEAAASQPSVRKAQSAPTASLLTPQASTVTAKGRRSRWQVAWLAGGAIALVGIGALVISSKRTRESPVAPAPSAPGSAAGIRALTDLPLPSSTNPDALGAYKRGMQLARDGATGPAQKTFEEALKLDGSLAAAHLRWTLQSLANDIRWEPQRQRQHLQAALAGRAALGDHDRLLLDALEPALRQPRDFSESERRVRAALARVPEDVDLLFWSGLLSYAQGAPDDAIASFDAATRIDPAFGLAWARKGVVLGDKNRIDEAFLAFDRCTSACPTSTMCLDKQTILADAEGRCDRVETSARQLIAIESDEARWHWWLALALYARSRPLEAVTSALQRAAERYPEEGTVIGGERRPGSAIWDEISLAVLAGDFERAERKLHEIDGSLAREIRQYPHGFYAPNATAVLLEMGRPSAALGVAQDYLKHADAWTLETWNVDSASVEMWVAERHAGAITADELVQRRDAWMLNARATQAKMHGLETGLTRFSLWIWAYGTHVQTPTDASDALAALPQFLPAPGASNRRLRGDLAIGKTYLLGGRPNDALAYLKRAAASCSALDFPVNHTHAQYWLGQALEQKGDTAGACAAYKVVLDRWGNAKPRSVTADKVKERVKALGCGR